MMFNPLLKKGRPLTGRPNQSEASAPWRLLRAALMVVALLGLVPNLAAQTTVTLLNYGSTGSFNSGSVTPAGVKTEGNMVNLTSSTTTGQRGWAEFDLSALPAGAVITSATVNFTTYGSNSSTATNNIYGFTGDAAALTGSALYTAAASGTSFNNTAWTADAANSKTLNAAGLSFIQDNIGSTVNLGFVRASTNVYNIYGFNSTTPPTLTVTYTGGTACSGAPTAGTANAWPVNQCANQPFWLYLTGQSAGAGTTITWQSSPTLAGPYTDLPASNSPAFQVSQAATTYYQARLTCNGSNEVFTAPIEVTTIAPIPTSTFTIDQTAPASATNFTSFASAIASLNCGIAGTVTFEVVAGSGPYTGPITIPAIAGASATNRVVFNGNDNVLTRNATASAERTTLTLDNADFITINNFTIEGTGTTHAWGIHLFGDADNNHITNNNIYMPLTGSSATNMLGVVASGSATSTTTAGTADNNLISVNTIIGGGGGVYMIGNGTTAPGMNNQIIGNTIQDYYAVGIEMDDQHNLLVSGNDMSRPTRSANSTTHYGIYLSGVNLNNLVEKNSIHNTFDALSTSTSTNVGIYVSADGTSVAPNRIQNNLIYNMTSGSIVYGMQAAAAEYAFFYHNTVSLDEESSTSASVTRGFWESSASAGAELRNNVISVTRGGTEQRVAVHLTAASAVVSNNNVLYVSSPGATEMVGALGSGTTYTPYTTLGDWQLAGYDLNSRSVDPGFADPANADFTPTNAMADNIGALVGVATDFVGTNRSGTPDPGAFEFDVPVSCDAPTGITAVVGPFQADLSWNIATQTGTFTVIYGPTGFNPTTGGTTVNNIAGTSYSITGLTPETSYQAYVQQNCGASGLSFQVGPFNFATPCVPLAAGTYTIDQTEPASATNFTSFQAAITAMCGGITGQVTFEVVANTGPYTGPIVIPAIGNAGPGSRVIFNGNQNVLTRNAAATAERTTLTLDNADYITINDFTIEGTGATYAWPIHLFGDVDFAHITNNTLSMPLTGSSATNMAGIVASGSATSTTSGGTADNNLIADNTIIGGGSGIVLTGDGITLAVNNQVLDNIILDYFANGIDLDDQGSALVSGNDISRPTRTNSSTTAHAGITLSGNASENNLIEKNRVHNSHDAMTTNTTISYGIYFTSAFGTAAAPNRVENNLIYNMNSNSTIYGLYNSNSDNAVYYHNTVSLDNTASTSTGVTRGFYQLTEAHNIVLRNNIITITRGGTAVKTGIYLGTAASTVSSDYNVIYVNSAAGNNNVGYNGTLRPALTDWQAQGYDLNSSDLNPDFASPATGDFTPTNFAIDDLGTPVGVLKDIIDEDRSTTAPDAGAYEFSVPACVTAEGGTATATTALFCNSGATTISATGFSSGAGTTYMWESSTDNFATAGVATGVTTPNNFSTGTITQTTYFRLVVTCATNSSTDYSNTVTITVNPVPTATATSNSPICAGQNLSLMGGTNIGTSFNWTGPNGFTSTDQNPTITGATAAATGKYVFTTTANGCTSAVSSVFVIVNETPVTPAVTSSAANLCTPGSSELSASSALAGTAVVLAEDFNTGATSWTIAGNSSTTGSGNVAQANFAVVTPPYSATTAAGAVHALSGFSVDGTGFVVANPDAAGSGTTTNTVLTSPTFSTVGLTSAALNFEHFFRYISSGSAESKVQYTTDGTTWTDLTTYTSTQGTLGTPASTSVPASASLALPAGALNQPTVQVRFSYTGGWVYYWAIDNLTVSGTLDAPNYNWTLVSGDGLPATTNTATITVNPTVTSTYQVTATNPVATACASSATVTITVANLSASITAQSNVSCFGGSNGSATVTPIGGTAPFTYSWTNGGGTAATATGLAAGTYTVTITDDNGCTTTATVVITEPSSALAASITAQTNVSCFSGTNGSATVTATGGTAPYSYSWSNGGGTSATATGLSAGTYVVTVTDDNGCTATASVTLTEPAALTASITAQTNATCTTGGSATVTANGGTGSYSYAWSPSGGTGATATNLAAGTYTVTVTDDNSCSTTATVTITAPASGPVASATQTNVSCFGGSNGTATISATGGTGPYTGTGTFTGLAAGTHTYTVTDANGCTSTVSVTITEPAALAASVSAQTNVSCFGGNNGSATVTATGGTAPYSYSWSNGAGNAATASGLAAGSYTVTVTDDNGCVTTAMVTITEPASAVSATITAQTHVSCFNGADGSLTVTATGGAGNYSYLWSPSGGTGATASGLSAGIYTVTVTDDNGCTTTATENINQPASALSATISAQTNASCNGASDGTATVTATGGTAPYSYSWSNGAGTSATATGLAAGTYTVTITDDNGCTTTASVTITQPAAVVATAGSNSPVAIGGTIELTATGGTSYTWTGPNGFASTDQNPTISGATLLNEGVYTVTVTQGGCSATATTTVTITLPTQMSGTYTINQDAPASATNFTSFTAAAAALNTIGVSGPVTINVVSTSGPYTEQFWLGQIPGSSATNTVTINGNQEELTFCGTVTNRDIIRLDGTDNVTINGLELTSTCNFGWGIHMMGDISNVTLTNNTINLLAATSTFIGHQAGIVASNSEVNPQVAGGVIAGITVTGNQVTNGYYAIRIQGASAATPASGVVVTNNIVNEAVGSGIDVRTLSNPVISGNQISMRVGSGYNFVNSVGLVVIGTENGLTVNANKVVNAGLQGMYLQNVNMTSTTRGMVANNMIGGGFQNTNVVYAVQLNNASYLDVYHNSTLADNGAAGAGFYVSNQFSRFLNMQNNSFAFTGASGYALQANNGNSNFLSIDNNNYWTGASGPKFVRFAGADRQTLGQLQSAPGPVNHNMQSDDENPLYVSATNLHLQAGSPLIGQAAPLASVTVDYDGDARTGATDIGADEFSVLLRNLAQELEADVYPNPFHQQLTVRLTDAQAGDVQVVLTDLMGRQIISRSYGVEAGATSLSVQVEENIAQGVYLLQVRQGEAAATFRVVKH